MNNEVKFNFVFIVLNGMPFIKHSINAVYKHAHKIIVVEGAVENCLFAANEDGSSVDGTVDYLKQTYGNDPKVKLIQGSWESKMEMHNAALAEIQEGYIWLVDCDEFWKEEDIGKIKQLIKQENPDQIWFKILNFWKSTDYVMYSDCDNFAEITNGIRRIFKYYKGIQFINHRPPTVDKDKDLQTIIDGDKTYALGIILFHYGYVTNQQVKQKIDLYNNFNWGNVYWSVDLHKWYNDFFLKWTPENKYELERKGYGVWVGNANSFSVLYGGTHPEAINEAFLKDIESYNNSEEI